MKDSNKKGFTLIELLAVIVVLAIILVITVPMILNSLSTTRQDALQASADSSAKFYENQLAMVALGKREPSFAIDAIFNSEGNLVPLTSARCISKEEAQILGLNTDDYSINEKCTGTTSLSNDCNTTTGYSTVKWDSNGNVTVKLVGAEDGKFMSGSTALTAISNSNSSNLKNIIEENGMPILSGTTNNTAIVNLKIYGNTEDGVSVGTETNNKIEITVSGLNLLNITEENIVVPESTVGSLNNATITPESIDMVRKGQYDYAYIPVNLKANTPYTLWYEYEVYDRSSTAQGETSVRTGFSTDITPNSAGRATYTTNTKDTRIYKYTPTENITTNVLFYANYGSAVPAKVKFKAMLLQGDYKLENIPEFEPYIEPQTHTITLSAPLRSNGEKRDYIDFEQGKVIRWINSDGTVRNDLKEEPITLPTIKTLGGTNVISTNTKVKPIFEGGY